MRSDAWTEDDLATLREMAAAGRTRICVSDALGRTVAAVAFRAGKEGIRFLNSGGRMRGSNSAPPRVEFTPPTLRISSADEDKITALYAGRRYEDATFIYQSDTNKLPAKSDRESKTGSTAQMCVEFAR